MQDVNGPCDRFLEWVHERTGGRIGESVSASEFFLGEGLDPRERIRLTKQWDSEGLISAQQFFAGTNASLTVDGLARVSAQRERRSNRRLRQTAAHNGLLCYLGEQDPYGEGWTEIRGFSSSKYSVFEGDRLTDNEINRAAEYLEEIGLIDGITVAEFSGPVTARLTNNGQDCIDQGGDVAEYLRDQRRTGTSITNNFSAGAINSSGAIAVGSSDFTQNVTANIDPTAMAAFVQMLQQELPNLQLGADRETAARTALDEVQREVALPDPDGGRVTEQLGRFAGYISDAGKPIVTALLMLLAKHYGLPDQ